MTKKAIVLLSGGLDSATLLALATEQEFSCYALTVDYGQRHNAEIECARRISAVLGTVKHRIIRVDIGGFGASALTDPSIEVPRAHVSDTIPVTYVPARNTVMLAVAVSWAEAINAEHIFIGVNSVDYSGYPDCRAEYFQAFQNLIRVATRTGVEKTSSIVIETPLLHLSKGEIIRTGIRLGVDYSMTISCYNPLNHKSCGICDACVIRAKGFAAAGMRDPAL